MKPPLTIALVVMIVLAMGSPWSLCAQQLTPSASAGADTGGDDQAPLKRLSPFAKGTILQIDPRSQSFALDTPDGPRSFVWTIHTYVYRGKEKLSMEKLQVGDHIKLSFSKNELGQSEVKRIKVDVADPQSQTNQQPAAVK